MIFETILGITTVIALLCCYNLMCRLEDNEKYINKQMKHIWEYMEKVEYIAEKKNDV